MLQQQPSDGCASRLAFKSTLTCVCSGSHLWKAVCVHVTRVTGQQQQGDERDSNSNNKLDGDILGAAVEDGLGDGLEDGVDAAAVLGAGEDVAHGAVRGAVLGDAALGDDARAVDLVADDDEREVRALRDARLLHKLVAPRLHVVKRLDRRHCVHDE